MNKRTISQLVSGVCMSAFGFFSLWAICQYHGTYFTESGSNLPNEIINYGFIGFVTVVGLWNMALAFVFEFLMKSEPERELPGFLQAYAAAWRKVTSQKWLLWLIGSLALASALGSLAEVGLSWHYTNDQFTQYGRGFQPPAFQPPLVHLLGKALSQEMGRTTGFLFPQINPVGPTDRWGLTAFAVLVLLPWANSRLKSIQERLEYACEVRFVRSIILPTALFCAIGALGGIYVLFRTYAYISPQMRAAIPGYSINNVLTVQTLAGLASWLVSSVALGAALTGGVVGSLKRVSMQQPIDLNTFFTDLARFFRPLAGLFALAGLLYWVAQIPGYIHTIYGVNTSMDIRTYECLKFVYSLIPVVLMFAPFVITSGELSVCKAISVSAKAWMNCGYNLLSFVALGITGLSTLFSLLYTNRLMGDHLGYGGIISQMVYLVFNVLAGVFMAVAVWEFYQQIRADSFEVEAEDPAALT